MKLTYHVCCLLTDVERLQLSSGGKGTSAPSEAEMEAVVKPTAEKLAASAILTMPTEKDQSLQEKLEEAMQPAFDELGGSYWKIIFTHVDSH